MQRHRIRIQGKIISGAGKTHKLPQSVWTKRATELSVENFKPGTLNIMIHTENLNEISDLINSFPLPICTIDEKNVKLGKLRVWPVLLMINNEIFDKNTFLVRLEKSKAKYFEVISDIDFMNDKGVRTCDCAFFEIITD